MTTGTNTHTALHRALTRADASRRMQVALAAGTHPDPAYAEVLLARCAVEPDFFVRDTLTWALTRQDHERVVPLLLAEVRDGAGQARSQALHTLSKLGDARGWSVITPALLRDPDDEVARAAWRTAVALAPEGAHARLAEDLATQLGRGERDVRLSLSRALAALGDAAGPALERAAAAGPDDVRRHALATAHLIEHPDDGFEASLAEAERQVALLGAPVAPPERDADR